MAETYGFKYQVAGFRNLLDLYQELHNMGYRCGQPLKEFIGQEICEISLDFDTVLP